eukprot:5402729-Amphidinium_carterae.1
MAMVSGFDAPPLADIVRCYISIRQCHCDVNFNSERAVVVMEQAQAFDERLGTQGVLMAAAVDGCAGELRYVGCVKFQVQMWEHPRQLD